MFSMNRLENRRHKSQKLPSIGMFTWKNQSKRLKKQTINEFFQSKSKETVPIDFINSQIIVEKEVLSKIGIVTFSLLKTKKTLVVPI